MDLLRSMEGQLSPEVAAKLGIEITSEDRPVDTGRFARSRTGGAGLPGWGPVGKKGRVSGGTFDPNCHPSLHFDPCAMFQKPWASVEDIAKILGLTSSHGHVMDLEETKLQALQPRDLWSWTHVGTGLRERPSLEQCVQSWCEGQLCDRNTFNHCVA